MIPAFDLHKKYLITRLVFVWIILVLLYQVSAQLLISQLENPILFRVDLDLTYWFIHLTGIADAIVSSRLTSLLFDCFLFLFCILALRYPDRQGIVITASAAFVLYALLLNSYMCWHYHNLIPLILLLIPLSFRSLDRFSTLFAGARYAVLYIYASAAVWKLCRGSLFNGNQMQWMIETNFIDRLSEVNYTLSFHEAFIVKFLEYPGLADYLLIAGGLMEISFLVGFFTRSFDVHLIFIGLIFHVLTTILVDVSFIQIWVLFITLVPLKWMETVEGLWPSAEESKLRIEVE